MSEVTQVISSLGFPIFMALMVFWYMATSFKKHTEKMVSELSLLNKAIMENTTALRSVVSRLSDLEHGIDDLEREVERGKRKD